MHSTLAQYKEQIAKCRDLFLKKSHDYGTSWRVLRISSLMDQIFIKAQRIRSIEEKGEQKVGDSIASEYIGIINYCVITLVQMELGSSYSDSIELNRLMSLYDGYAQKAEDLMMAKNHDYGEAWREMQLSTFTDMILSKFLRSRQIMSNEGQTLASEGVDANLYDMINYAVFALIRMGENTA
jgi:hypothetical protein